MHYFKHSFTDEAVKKSLEVTKQGRQALEQLQAKKAAEKDLPKWLKKISKAALVGYCSYYNHSWWRRRRFDTAYITELQRLLGSHCTVLGGSHEGVGYTKVTWD